MGNFMDKASLEFERFLTTGSFGDIKLNSSLNEVYGILGSPNNTTTEYWDINNTTMTNLFYGDCLILTFLDSKLHVINFSCKSKDLNLPSNLKISWLSLLQEMTYRAFCVYLKTLDIECYRVDISPFEDEGILLWLPRAKIEIVFDSAKDYRIDRISCLASKPSGWSLIEC